MWSLEQRILLPGILAFHAARVIAVDLFQDQQIVWLISDAPFSLRLRMIVVPEKGLHRAIPGFPAIRVEFFQALAKVLDKPEIGARVARWVHGLIARLDHTLPLGDAALLLRRGRIGRQ